MALRDLVPWIRSGKEVPVRREMSPFGGMEGMFDRFLAEPWGMPTGREWDMVTPRLDIVENDKEVVVTAEIPGMNEKDFDISLTADALTIHGEKKAEREEKKGNYYRMERSYGSFHRTVPLPCEVDPDKVEARYSKGVLNITLPKLPEEKQHRKRIEVH